MFLIALLMYSQSPHSQNHQVIPWTCDSGNSRTKQFGDQRNKSQPQRPLPQPCPTVSLRQLLSSRYIQPAPFLAPAFSPACFSIAALTWAGQPALCDSRDLCRHTQWASLCFVNPEVFPVSTSFIPVHQCPTLGLSLFSQAPVTGQEITVVSCAR